MNCNCEMCSFRNQRATATAIVIQDNKLLVLKRNQDPFKDCWDLPGGYLQEGETVDQCLKREMKEELQADDIRVTFMKALPGLSPWKGEDYPTLNHFFLTELSSSIRLNEENSEYRFVDLKGIDPKEIAFDANQKMVAWLKDNFVFDLARVKELTSQLDGSAVINEQSFYKAVLDGFVSKIYDGEKLIGMGWIFARQTMLRKQAVVEDMIVDDSFRGKGYGKKLLLELIDWAKREGVEVIELTSNPARVAANELYKKTGFVLHPTNHYLYKLQ